MNSCQQKDTSSGSDMGISGLSIQHTPYWAILICSGRSISMYASAENGMTPKWVKYQL